MHRINLRMLLRGHWQAGKALLKARDVAEAQAERAVLWQILVSLAKVEASCTNTGAADRLRDQAWEVVGYLVEHAVEMRDVFLGQQAVVQLLGES